MTGVQTCALPICFPVTITGGNVGANVAKREQAAARKAAEAAEATGTTAAATTV